MTQTLQHSEILECTLPPVRVLAIDNRPEELEQLRIGFAAAGIPCACLLYDSFSGIEKEAYIKTTHARFVFIDLNLEDVEFTKKATIVGHLENAISQLEITGPFALIFWTKHPDYVSEVMKLFKTRVNPDFNLPFFFSTMNKNDLSLPAKDDATYSAKLNGLREKIKQIFLDKMIFSSIVTWENKVAEAASNALKSLHDTVRKAQESGVAQKEEDFARLLKMLASNAWGQKAAKENWGHSVASGISPFLSDNLDYGISSDHTYSSIWNKSLNQDPVSKLPTGVSAHRLNTSCALDTTCKTKEAHGVWLEFNLTITPEFIFTFGDSGRHLIDDFINTKKLNEAGVEFESKVKLGMLDITRSCDYANKKHGLRRFVLGAIIPVDLNGYICWDKESPNKKHEAIHKLPHVSLDNNGIALESIIQVNFRYVLSIPDNSPLLADSSVFTRFRVRKQILTDIISKFGAHTTSPGILSFH